MKLATIATESLLVLCPSCGEAQPNPDNGADNWTPEEVRSVSEHKTCVACDARFAVQSVNKALVLK